jgi:succinate dehydrogenase/fumarate reductase flavoprotein subunit
MLAAAHRHVLRMEQGYSQELTRRERELERREADMARREGDLQKRSSALTREERAIYRKDRERLRSKLLLVVHKELGHIMWEYCGMARSDAGLRKAITYK